MNPILASSLLTKRFLDPENYTAPLHGKYPLTQVLKKILKFIMIINYFLIIDRSCYATGVSCIT